MNVNKTSAPQKSLKFDDPNLEEPDFIPTPPIDRRLILYQSLFAQDKKNSAMIRSKQFFSIRINDDDESLIFKRFWNYDRPRIRKNLKFLSRASILNEHRDQYKIVHKVREARNLSFLCGSDRVKKNLAQISSSKRIKNLEILSDDKAEIIFSQLRRLRTHPVQGLSIRANESSIKPSSKIFKWFDSNFLFPQNSFDFSLLAQFSHGKSKAIITGKQLNQVLGIKKIYSGNLSEASFATITSEFNRFENIQQTDLVITPMRIKFFDNLCNKSKNLKKLNLKLEKSDSEANWDETLIFKSLSNISFLIELDSLSLSFSEHFMNHKISLNSLNSLSHLKRIELQASTAKKFPFFNLYELANVILSTKSLEFLSITGTFEVKSFDEFLSKTIGSCPKLSEIVFDLNFTSQIEFSKNLMHWLSSHPELSYITFLIGTRPDSPNVHAESIPHLLQGILALPKPYRLNLAIGHEDYFWSSFTPIEDHSMISNFISELTNTRVLHIRMGTGYTNEQELRDIMEALEYSECVQDFMIGEIFQNKTNAIKKEIIEFLSLCMEMNAFKKAMIGPPEWCIDSYYLIKKLNDSLTPRMWGGSSKNEVKLVPDFSI